jgi:hypothetical protein
MIHTSGRAVLALGPGRWPIKRRQLLSCQIRSQHPPRADPLVPDLSAGQEAELKKAEDDLLVQIDLGADRPSAPQEIALERLRRLRWYIIGHWGNPFPGVAHERHARRICSWEGRTTP